MQLPRATIWTVFIIWCLAMGLSIVAMGAEPTGSGFTRGLNRISGFLGWQMAAAVMALALWIGVRPLPRGDMLRRLGRVPGWWAVALVLLVAGWIAVGNLGSEFSGRTAAPATPPGPTTAPTDTQ